MPPWVHALVALVGLNQQVGCSETSLDTHASIELFCSDMLHWPKTSQGKPRGRDMNPAFCWEKLQSPTVKDTTVQGEQSGMLGASLGEPTLMGASNSKFGKVTSRACYQPGWE